MPEQTVKTVTLICGGASTEHAISIQSAQNVLNNLMTRYEVQLIYITQAGAWRMLHQPGDLLSCTEGTMPEATPSDPILINTQASAQPWFNLRTQEALHTDVVFPLVHGTHGEDGTLQGLLSLLPCPYVGCATLGAALAMNKQATKSMLAHAGIPVTPGTLLQRGQTPDLDALIQAYGLPLFIKPNSLGSSVGIHHVTRRDALQAALDDAWRYDHEVLVETAIDAREIECAVLDGDPPQAAVLAEINPTHAFYSYEAKYLDQEGAHFHLPAQLTPEESQRIQTMAIQAFQCLQLKGYARVDFFLDRTNHALYLNEINTIPGFTAISMFPQMWAASGLGLSALLDQLINLAIERHNFERTHAPLQPHTTSNQDE